MFYRDIGTEAQGNLGEISRQFVDLASNTWKVGLDKHVRAVKVQDLVVTPRRGGGGQDMTPK